MKRLIWLLAAFLSVSCQTGHEIQLRQPKQSIYCPCPYPQTKSRFIHAIEVYRSSEAQTALIGVTLVDPVSRSVSCALMSAEGMAVLEVSSTPAGMEISRALPPLDSPNFARNMLDDIEMIFLAPRSTDVQKGTLADGRQVCRYPDEDGWLDVVHAEDGGIEFKRYTKTGSLSRSVTLVDGASNSYEAIEVSVPGFFRYRLKMSLIETQTSGDELFAPDSNKGGDK